ncbi:MAG: ATPase domain-containing protein [Dehalococcoidia bacterium]|jgi:circadian clock protein KaiC
MAEPITPSLDLLSTGSESLDRILGGGIPAYSVTLLVGEPGSGKTIFAVQTLFHVAKQGKKALYFTTLSEPTVKLIRYMQQFSYFDVSLLDDRVVVADLGSAIRTVGAEKALEEAMRRVEEESPDLVIIDSFKAIRDLLDGPGEGRRAIYDLVVHMASWGVTTILVGEYERQEILASPEASIADGIIYLGNVRQELTAEREMEVLKMRGADYVTGIHFFTITSDGFNFYPRVRAPSIGRVSSSQERLERVPTGVAGLDQMLHGGLLPMTSTQVEGPTGIGKTLIGLNFLMEGARRGEKSVLFTLEETPDQLHSIAVAFGWDLPELEKKGGLSIVYTSPVELSTDLYLNDLRREIESMGAKRVFLDSLTSLALGIPSDRRFKELVYAISKYVNALGATLMFSTETTQPIGTAQLPGVGTSAMTDQVIVLRYVELEGRLERAISVLKARATAHDPSLRRFTISPEGLKVGEGFADMQGVLTGIPRGTGK